MRVRESKETVTLLTSHFSLCTLRHLLAINVNCIAPLPGEVTSRLDGASHQSSLSLSKEKERRQRRRSYFSPVIVDCEPGGGHIIFDPTAPLRLFQK